MRCGGSVGGWSTWGHLPEAASGTRWHLRAAPPSLRLSLGVTAQQQAAAASALLERPSSPAAGSRPGNSGGDAHPLGSCRRALPPRWSLCQLLRRQAAQADRAWGQSVAGALRTRQPRPAGAQMPEVPALTSLPTPVHTGSFCQCEPPALHRVTRLPAQGRSLGLPGPPCSHHRTHPAAQGQCHPWPAGPPARPSPRRLCPQPVAGRCGPGWPPVGACDGSRFSTAGHPSATPAHGPSWVLHTPEPLIFFSHGS